MKCKLVLISFLFATNSFGQGQVEDGKKIFLNSCASCHIVSEKSKWEPFVLSHKTEWLSKWIANSAKMIYEKDKEAIRINNEFNKQPHLAFPFEKNKMENLIAYLRTLK